MIKKLSDRISDASVLTESLEDTAFEYGFNSKRLQQILKYWKGDYLTKWSEKEAFLNQFSQFTTQIQGLVRCLIYIKLKHLKFYSACSLKIHYIHVKPKTTANTKVYKLILLVDKFQIIFSNLLKKSFQHGWPGSVREFYEIIPMLTKPSNDNIAFEVIVPSLPGYGWSEGASKQGLGPLKVSVVLRNLMIRLGFDKFYIQGSNELKYFDF